MQPRQIAAARQADDAPSVASNFPQLSAADSATGAKAHDLTKFLEDSATFQEKCAASEAASTGTCTNQSSPTAPSVPSPATSSITQRLEEWPLRQVLCVEPSTMENDTFEKKVAAYEAAAFVGRSGAYYQAAAFVKQSGAYEKEAAAAFATAAVYAAAQRETCMDALSNASSSLPPSSARSSLSQLGGALQAALDHPPASPSQRGYSQEDVPWYDSAVWSWMSDVFTSDDRHLLPAYRASGAAELHALTHNNRQGIDTQCSLPASSTLPSLKQAAPRTLDL